MTFPIKGGGENLRHSHVTKTLKQNINCGFFFYLELVRLLFFFNTLVVPLRTIASHKYENNFMLVIFA